MNREYLIQITNKLYSLTVLFPKKEPLRYKMREVAISILGSPKVEDLEVLDSFFEVAKVQRWVKENSRLAIQQEYAKLKGELTELKADERQLSLVADLLNIHEEKQDNKTPEVKENEFSFLPAEAEEKPVESVIVNVELQTDNSVSKIGSMSERQEKIIDFLKENGRAQVWQTKQILPEVTKRTLRRDFEHMLQKGLIERMGERNDTYYQVKIR